MKDDGREKGDLFWKNKGEGLLANCGVEGEKKRETWSHQGAYGVRRAVGSDCPRKLAGRTLWDHHLATRTSWKESHPCTLGSGGLEVGASQEGVSVWGGTETA